MAIRRKRRQNSPISGRDRAVLRIDEQLLHLEKTIAERTRRSAAGSTSTLDAAPLLFVPQGPPDDSSSPDSSPRTPPRIDIAAFPGDEPPPSSPQTEETRSAPTSEPPKPEPPPCDSSTEIKASTLILWCEDPTCPEAKPPQTSPASTLLHYTTARLPTLEQLKGASGHYERIVLYGSRGDVDETGAPCVFNGHPRSPSLTAFFADLQTAGLKTDCLVVDFSLALGWLPELRPLLSDDGLLLATAARSRYALSSAALTEVELPAPSPRPTESARALLQKAEDALARRFNALCGSPHAVYRSRSRELLRSSANGLAQYGLIDAIHASRDLPAVARSLAWLRQNHVGADRSIAVEIDSYQDADYAFGFLAEVSRRLT